MSGPCCQVRGAETQACLHNALNARSRFASLPKSCNRLAAMFAAGTVVTHLMRCATYPRKCQSNQASKTTTLRSIKTRLTISQKPADDSLKHSTNSPDLKMFVLRIPASSGVYLMMPPQTTQTRFLPTAMRMSDATMMRPALSIWMATMRKTTTPHRYCLSGDQKISSRLLMNSMKGSATSH